MIRAVVSRVAVVLALTTTCVSAVMAQQPPAKPPAPIKVDVVLSRSQGDKKISSLPFTLWTSPDQRFVNSRMGVDVPIGMVVTTRPPGGNDTSSTTTSRPEYRYVGTSIDCMVTPVTGEDSQFFVEVRVQDSSIFTADGDTRAALKTADPMAFRTFSTSNRLPMRVGQTVQFSSASDPITGQVLKVDVTISVGK